MSDLDESSDGSIFDEPYVPPADYFTKRNQPAEETFDNDAAYRAQFDRNSDQFHGGDKTLVPTGGKRVPDHMKDHANWESFPEYDIAPVNPNAFGPEYAKIYARREEYGLLKKVANAVLPNMAALVKNRALLEKCQVEQKKEHILSLIESNIENQKASLDELNTQMLHWKGSKFDQPLVTIHELASNMDLSLDGNQLLNERVKMLTIQIKLVHTDLLQQLKAAKNDFLKTKQ